MSESQINMSNIFLCVATWIQHLYYILQNPLPPFLLPIPVPPELNLVIS